jgi:hypothetical protein
MSFWHSLTQPQAVLLAGLVGALGALIAGLCVNALSQFMAFRGQDKRRWEETRRLSYARMYRSVMAAWDAYDDVGDEWDDSDTINKLRAEIRDAYSEATIIVRNRNTDKALDRLHEAADYLWNRRGREWPQVERYLHDHLNDFLRAARKELGMPRRRMDSFDEYKAAYLGKAAHSPVAPTTLGPSIDTEPEGE